MPKIIDVSKEIGKKYGRYSVLSKAPERGRLKLTCQCDCGNIRSVSYQSLKNGTSKSCGCFKNDISSLRMSGRPKKHGDALKKSRHNYVYARWGDIKDRCFNPNNKNYKDYGGRGIIMHQPWKDDYLSFKTWILENLGERKDGESIDRINVDEGYVPGNLRWANDIIQANNRRNNIKESDIIGQKFNRLEIISIAGADKHGHKIVLCKCECGKLKEVNYYSVQYGGTKSCGCLLKKHIQKKYLNKEKGLNP